MKLYTPPEMSEKLVKLGCVSQSSFYYFLEEEFYFDPEDRVRKSHNVWNLRYTNITPPSDVGFLPAFEFEDFAGPESNDNLFKIVKQGDSILDKKYRISHSSNWVDEVGREL